MSQAKLAGAGLIFFLVAIWSASCAGLSRWYIKQGLKGNQVALVEEAASLSPSDPEAHYALGHSLLLAGRLAEGVQALERAVKLRPRDHFLWLRLGHARDKLDDNEGALAAYKKAISLAPFYANPRWYHGSLLLKMGRSDEAFPDLRAATGSNPELFRELIDLSWKHFKGDAKAVLEALQPQTSEARLGLARFFIKEGKTGTAIELFQAAGNISGQDRSSVVAELISAKSFREAFQVWSTDPGFNDGAPGAISNAGFEHRIILDEKGFGWRIAHNVQNVRASLDGDRPYTGLQSLHFEFAGNSNPSTPLLSQLVLVEANSKYRLSFAARIQEVVTGGLMVMRVVDSTTDKAPVLAELTLPPATTGWQKYVLDFKTLELTKAALVSLQRQNCQTSPCPIFGHGWFDEFLLERFSVDLKK